MLSERVLSEPVALQAGVSAPAAGVDVLCVAALTRRESRLQWAAGHARPGRLLGRSPLRVPGVGAAWALRVWVFGCGLTRFAFELTCACIRSAVRFEVRELTGQQLPAAMTVVIHGSDAQNRARRTLEPARKNGYAAALDDRVAEPGARRA